MTFEDFDVSAHIPALVSGENVLAIHGLNVSTTSSDALFLPELVTSAPHDTPVGRVDEVRAARNLKVTWTPEEENV